MALSETKRKCNERYIKSHYGKLNISYPLEYIGKIKAEAESHSESIAGYVKKAIDKRMQEEKKTDD